MSGVTEEVFHGDERNGWLVVIPIAVSVLSMFQMVVQERCTRFRHHSSSCVALARG